jgi:hypothetical protein
VRQPELKSFVQGGFECSTHKLRNGTRLDLIASTQHDRFAAQDFARLKEIGIQTAREGIRWHLIEPQRGSFDFSSVAPIMDAAQKAEIQVIWDVLHFGWPDYLDIFEPDWVEAFAELASQFGRFVRSRTSGTAYIAPVNEISFSAWAGGDASYIYPYQRGRGGELKRQLVRGFARASEALRAELTDLWLVSPEPVIHIVGNPYRPEDIRQANEYREAMFESWDMITGRVQPELGGQESYLELLGVNYYDRNQWWNFGGTIRRGEADYRPFRDILIEVYERYRRPMFIAETGCEDSDRPSWFAYICEEARAAMDAGVPLYGICLYPILNHPGWEDNRHCHNGLWDYANENGWREIYEPLAREIRKQQQIRTNQGTHELRSDHSTAGGSDLLLSSSMELRLPAAATPDEPLC